MDEFIHIKKDEIHEHILLRLSNEYEMLDDLETSMKYYKNRLILVQNKNILVKLCNIIKKNE